MSQFIRQPFRGLRILIATALLATFFVAAPVTAMAEPNDALPGVAAPTSPFEEYVDPLVDPVDIYGFTLTEGQFVHLGVAQTTEATAVVGFFGPGTTDIADLSSAISSATIATGTGYTDDVTVHAGQAGDYYLSVAAVSGNSTYSVKIARYTRPANNINGTSVATNIGSGRFLANAIHAMISQRNTRGT